MKVQYRVFKVVKKVRVKLPHGWVQRTGDGKTNHYFEGIVQIGRVTVAYLILNFGRTIEAAYAFGRLSDKKANKDLGKYIVERRLIDGICFLAHTNRQMTSKIKFEILKLGAREMAVEEKVGWMKKDVELY